MGEQRTLGSVAYDTKGKVTRRERFLTEMDTVIPWARLLALVAPHYAVAGRGRRPLPVETMLRVYFLQQWFDLSAPQAEDMLYDSESMRRFARVELGEDTVPDESTILRFRHLLEQHLVTAQMFAAIRGLLEERRLLLKAGTIVDATIIAAPSSTKNATGTRDPENPRRVVQRRQRSHHLAVRSHAVTDRPVQSLPSGRYGSVSCSTWIILRGRVTTAPHDVDLEPTPTGRESTAGPERELTHLALDAAGHDAAPTGAHPLRAQFVEDEAPGLLLAPLVQRGEELPHGAASGGSRATHG